MLRRQLVIRLPTLRNWVNTFRMFRSLFCMFFIFGCAHRPTLHSLNEDRLSAGKFKEVRVSEPIELALKGKIGQVEKTKYNSASKTEVFEGESLTNTVEESIEFTSKAEITKINGELLTAKITTSNKDGQIDLHDFAMPEIGEELFLTYRPTGAIVKAGNFASNSLYFVPAISLPREKVNIGDTWTMESHWITDGGVPLTLRLLSILRGFLACGAGDTCADLELSGEVTLDTKTDQVLFDSLWKGRLIFAVKRGSVLWSLVESHEAWTTAETHREVHSCLESTLVDPLGWNPWKDETHKCLVPK